MCTKIYWWYIIFLCIINKKITWFLATSQLSMIWVKFSVHLESGIQSTTSPSSRLLDQLDVLWTGLFRSCVDICDTDPKCSIALCKDVLLSAKVCTLYKKMQNNYTLRTQCKNVSKPVVKNCRVDDATVIILVRVAFIGLLVKIKYKI